MIYLFLDKHLLKGQQKGSSGRCSEACSASSESVVLEANMQKPSLCSSHDSWDSSACPGSGTAGLLWSSGGTGDTAERSWLSLGVCPRALRDTFLLNTCNPINRTRKITVLSEYITLRFCILFFLKLLILKGLSSTWK